MEKVIRDGKVAVLVSPGFGAGWYTWNTDYSWLLFHPKIVEMVEQGKQSEINEEWMESNIEDCPKNIYCGGARDLKIVWLNLGTPFRVEEYDGHETLYTIDDLILIA